MAAHTFVSGLIMAVLLLSQVIRVIFKFFTKRVVSKFLPIFSPVLEHNSETTRSHSLGRFKSVRFEDNALRARAFFTRGLRVLLKKCGIGTCI
jgi:uncharacterized membrane protein SpoIIM required for sporulation